VLGGGFIKRVAAGVAAGDSPRALAMEGMR
jgi:hypothetical protein